MPNLQALLETIRRGEASALSPEEVRELLAWLGGGREELTQPDHDPVLLQMVLFRLDAALFRDGQLDLRAAGVDGEVEERERKVRFRRLASVFHPDRFPSLADWLTVRSQAVHTAYAAFKKNPKAAAPASSPEASHAATRQKETEPRRKRRPGAIRRFLLQLRHRFGHDRNLGTKIIAGLAVLALLPVANLLLAPSAPDVDRSEARTQTQTQTQTQKVATAERPSGTPAPDATSEPDDSVDNQAPAAETIGAFSFEDEAPINTSTVTASPTTGSGTADNALSMAARRALGGDADVPAPDVGVDGLPTDERLADLGLASDNDRLYALLGAGETERTTPRRAPQTATRSSRQTEAAPPPAERTSEPPAEPGTEPQAESSSRSARTSQPTPTIRAPTPEREPAGPSEPPPARADSTEPEPEQGAPNEAVASTTQPAAEPEAPAPAEARPAPELPPSERILGPLRIHPAGRLLTRFADALEAGDAAAVQQLFSRDSGAQRYRDLAAGDGPRSVQLRVLRMDKDDTAWRVQTELAVFSVVDDRIDRIETPLATFWLDTRDDTLKIVRTTP